MNIIAYNGKGEDYKRCDYCMSKKAYFYDTINEKYLCSSLHSNCPGWRGQQEIHKHKCFYCKTRPARVYFPTADRYCCQKSYRNCPGIKQKMRASTLKQYENYPSSILKREIRDGKHPCIYCGMTANYLVKRGPCCSRKAKECPGHKLWLRKVMIQKYIDNPELKEKMRNVSREVHNRSSVKEAKSEKMFHLHNDDCLECKQFQQKFKVAHARRRGNKNETL